MEVLQPLEALPSGRGGMLRVWRPRQRPLLLVNLYLPASSRSEAAEILDGLMLFAAGTEKACILAGDFNLTQDMWPISTACASGRWRAADEMILGDATPPSTHRREDGSYTQCIDFALGTSGIVFAHRGQQRGPADHDAVFFDVRIDDALPRPTRFQLRHQLEGPAGGRRELA